MARRSRYRFVPGQWLVNPFGVGGGCFEGSGKSPLRSGRGEADRQRGGGAAHDDGDFDRFVRSGMRAQCDPPHRQTDPLCPA